MVSFLWQFVEFSFVLVHVSDEIYKVLWLGEFSQVFSINNESQLIFQLNDQFDLIQRVQSVLLQLAVQ